MPYGGIIPACAGNTGRPHSPLAATGDHPRVCGEHVSPVIDGINEFRMVEGDHPRVCGEHLAGAAGDVLAQGSSPRVRGTPRRSRRRRARPGIIPACAGNTRREGRSVRRSRDHPRVCGEHLGGCHAGAVQDGSSPRVRGTPCHGLHHACRPGIIPACAGNTMPMFSPWRKPRDHPRVCGEHDIQLTVTQCAPGSSPRVRGTL